VTPSTGTASGIMVPSTCVSVNTRHTTSVLGATTTTRGRRLHCSLRTFYSVTPSFKGKTECIDHVCARIKLHTRLDIMNTKNSAIRIKSYYKP
jgi:hypothetical protein